jgi:hypothetical protein
MMIRSATSLSRMVFLVRSKPSRVIVFTHSPIRQDHQSFLDALSRLRCCRDNYIDISGRTLIAMSGKRVAADSRCHPMANDKARRRNLLNRC